MAKLSKNIFLWDNSVNLHGQNQFMEYVKLFLSKPNNRKHTHADFFAMIPYSSAVEFQYTLS